MVRWLVVVALSFAGLVMWAPSASAADPLVVAGSAPATAHGPGSVRFTYTLQVASGLDSVTATTIQDLVLPAKAASVKFDGVPVAAGNVTASGGNITVTLGTVATGTHVLSFDALVQATPSKITSSSIEVSYQVPGAPPAVASSGPVSVDINEPDISISSMDFDSSEGGFFIAGVGQPFPVDVDITNNGYGAPPVTLLVDLPPGFVPDKGGAVSEDGSPVACTSPTAAQISCPLGTIAHGAFRSVEISLNITTAAAIGKKSTITVTATPDEGVDTNPKDNSLAGDVLVLGPSHLSTMVTPAAPTVTVGKSVALSISIHNDGPDTALIIEAFLTLGDFDTEPENVHFTITGFDARGATPLDDTCPPFEPVEPCTDAEWHVGKLAAGATVTARLTVTATSVGTTPLVVGIENGVPEDCGNDKNCGGGEFPLTAVAAPTATSPSPQSSGPQLVNTGATPWPLAWLGSSMVLLGAAVLHLARPKRRRA
jgi:hypothetical protein